MRKTTFDMLDSEISSKYDEYISYPTETRERFFTEKFWLDVPNWEKYHNQLDSLSLQWQEFKYTDVSNSNPLENIINSSYNGIYMFIVKANNTIYDLPKFVLYVGISGATESNRPISKRLEDYFRISSIKKRNSIMRLLQKYYKNIYIAYSILDLTPAELQEIETSLIGFFYPNCNKDDFPIELQPTKKSF